MSRRRGRREQGVAYPPDTEWQKEFEAEFPYEPTEDQITGAEEIKQDMQKPRPMDRLLCGDVGYGKTELAMRAAFKAVEFGKQVAVLVPTTVLAEQHERSFRERMVNYPFHVESISRFKSGKEQKETIRRTGGGGGRHPDRHAPAAQQGRQVHRSRTGRDRRGAALRRHA